MAGWSPLCCSQFSRFRRVGGPRVAAHSAPNATSAICILDLGHRRSPPPLNKRLRTHPNTIWLVMLLNRARRDLVAEDAFKLAANGVRQERLIAKPGEYFKPEAEGCIGDA